MLWNSLSKTQAHSDLDICDQGLAFILSTVWTFFAQIIWSYGDTHFNTLRQLKKFPGNEMELFHLFCI